jgi:ABC-type sulfate/molybdate transport systems ATPase subunit
LHITHNRPEATRLGDFVLLLEKGKIRRLEPEELREPDRATNKVSKEPRTNNLLH